jgi:hypothetical protein
MGVLRINFLLQCQGMSFFFGPVVSVCRGGSYEIILLPSLLLVSCSLSISLTILLWESRFVLYS